MTNTFKVDDRVGFLKSSFESRHIRGTILGEFQNDCWIILLDEPDRDGNKADVLHYSCLTLCQTT